MAVKQASFFAPDLTVVGTIHSPGTLEIEGTVKGDVAVADVIVGSRGQLNARIGAGRLASAGTVAGTIKARAVAFLDGGRFRGDVEYEALSIAPDSDVEARFHPVERGSPRMAVLPAIPEETFRIGDGRATAAPKAVPAAAPKPLPPADPAPAMAEPPTPAAPAAAKAPRKPSNPIAILAWVIVLLAGAGAVAVIASPDARDWARVQYEALRASTAASPTPPPAPAPVTAEPPATVQTHVPPLPLPPPASLRELAPADTPAPAEPVRTQPEPVEPPPTAAAPVIVAPPVEAPPPSPPAAVAPVTTPPPLPKAPVVAAPPPAASTPKTEAPPEPAATVEPAQTEPAAAEPPQTDMPVPVPKPDRPAAAAAPPKAPPVSKTAPAAPAQSKPRTVTSTPDSDGCTWVVQCLDTGPEAGKCVSTRQCGAN